METTANGIQRTPPMLTLAVRPAGKCKQLPGQKMWKQLQGSAAVRSRETFSP